MNENRLLMEYVYVFMKEKNDYLERLYDTEMKIKIDGYLWIIRPCGGKFSFLHINGNRYYAYEINRFICGVAQSIIGDSLGTFEKDKELSVLEDIRRCADLIYKDGE